MEYRKDSRIAGVILNQMTAMLYPRVRKMIEEELSVPVLGYVPKVEECVLESRHLGLVMPEEVEGFREKLMKTGRNTGADTLHRQDFRDCRGCPRNFRG